jgi:hypothetical protein
MSTTFVWRTGSVATATHIRLTDNGFKPSFIANAEPVASRNNPVQIVSYDDDIDHITLRRTSPPRLAASTGE